MAETRAHAGRKSAGFGAPTFRRIFVYLVGFLPAIFTSVRRSPTSSAPIRSRPSSTRSGLWALRFLILALLVTPLRAVARVNFIRYR